MIAAYAIEAVIITLFAMAGVIGFVHSYLYRRKNPNKQFQQTPLDKKRQSFTAFESLPTDPAKQNKRGRKNFRAALRGTITGFWEGAVMFSISLGVAGLIVFFKKEGSYTLFFSALVSVFSSSCVYVLWPLIDGVTRRKKTYNLLLLATTVQQFILYGIFQYYIKLRLDPNSDHGDKNVKTVDKEKLWEEHCLFLISPKRFIERIVTTTLVFASVVFIKMVIVDYLRPVLLKYKPNCWLSRFFNEQWIKDKAAIMNLAWKGFIGLCGFGMMWASFARIIQGKQRLMDLSGGDNLAGENEWGFGQIVALLTWAPYTLEFIAIWKSKNYPISLKFHGCSMFCWFVTNASLTYRWLPKGTPEASPQRRYSFLHGQVQSQIKQGFQHYRDPHISFESRHHLHGPYLQYRCIP